MCHRRGTQPHESVVSRRRAPPAANPSGSAAPRHCGRSHASTTCHSGTQHDRPTPRRDPPPPTTSPSPRRHTSHPPRPRRGVASPASCSTGGGVSERTAGGWGSASSWSSRSGSSRSMASRRSDTVVAIPGHRARVRRVARPASSWQPPPVDGATSTPAPHRESLRNFTAEDYVRAEGPRPTAIGSGSARSRRSVLGVIGLIGGRRQRAPGRS